MRTPKLLTNLHRLGHDSFRLDGPQVIYIDPWKLPKDSIPAGIILVTHDHYDHCSPENVNALSGPDTVVIANAGAAQKLGANARVLRPGETTKVGDVTIEAVPAYNTNKFRSAGDLFHPPVDGNGYIITVDGERLYHAGDTDFIPEMTQIKCDVALLPVSGTYVMTADEAFEAARTIDAQIFVPMHYGDIVGDQGDVEKFRHLCEEQGIKVAILPAEPESGVPEG